MIKALGSPPSRTAVDDGRSGRRLVTVTDWSARSAVGLGEELREAHPGDALVGQPEQFGQVLAGVRLTPTTAKVGIYSYMIRDAQRGLMPTIPDSLLFEEAPVASHIWESSRVFVTEAVPAKLLKP